MDPLFACEHTLFEEGTKKNRSEVEHSLAYCRSFVEMDSLVRRENNYDSSHPLRCKLGLDKGQGFLKFTAQYMEIAYNSIKTTLILAASPCIETHNNLFKVLQKVFPNKSFNEIPSTTFFLSCDLKVQAMAAGSRHFIYVFTYAVNLLSS